MNYASDSKTKYPSLGHYCIFISNNKNYFFIACFYQKRYLSQIIVYIIKGQATDLMNINNFVTF